MTLSSNNVLFSFSLKCNSSASLVTNTGSKDIASFSFKIFVFTHVVLFQPLHETTFKVKFRCSEDSS
jgi:hypothetical protein